MVKTGIKKVKNQALTEAKADVEPLTVVVNLANNYLPEMMRLRLEEGEVRLYLYVDTGVVDSEGHRVTEWRLAHVIYSGKHIRDAMLGYIKGIETIANFEMMIRKQMEADKFKQEVKVES